MTFSRAPLAVAFALTLAGCSGPLLGADVTEPKLCLMLQAVTIPAAPAIPTGVTVPDQTVTWTGDLDVGSSIPGLDKAGAVTGAIHMLSLTTAASPATTDLSSITSASVAVTDATGNALSFMHYTRPTPVTTPSELDMVLDDDLNLLDELQGGVLHYTITFAGLPPTTAWTADIETCFSAHLTIDALKALQ